MTKGFSAFLKFLACLALFLCIFPFLSLKSSVFVQGDMRPYIEQLMACILGFIGVWIGILTENTAKRKPVLFKILCVPMLVLPIGASAVFAYLLGESANTPEFVMLAALVSFCFVAGIFAAPKDYRNVFGKMFLALNVCFFLLFRFLEVFSEGGGNTLRSVLILTIILAIISVVNNQSNIDALMERRRYDKKSLPKRIRYFNLSLLFIFFGLVLLLMIFRKQIGMLIVIIRNGLVAFVLGIFEFIAWLRSLFIRQSGGDFVGGYDDDTLFIQNGNSIIDEIFTVIFYAALVFVVIKYHKQIIMAIKKFLLAAASAISELMKKTAGAVAPPNNGYYEDTEEYLDPSKSLPTDTSVNGKKRRLGKMYREYRRTKDPSEKLRLGYAVAVSAIAEKYSKIKKSDTPLEICEAFKDIFGEELVSTTESYNLVRYNEKGFDGDFTALDGLLKKLEI